MEKLMMKSGSRDSIYGGPAKRRFRGRHLLLVLLILGIAFGTYRKLHSPKASGPPQKGKIEAAASQAGDAGKAVSSPKTEPTEKFEIRHLTVHSGDTLPAVLKTSGVPEMYSNEWQEACESAPLAQIKEDDELIFVLNRESGLPVKVIFSRYDGPTYTLRKNSKGWECRSEETIAKAPVKTVHIVFSRNFYDSCIAGGLPAQLISNLADLFAYDLDVTADLKEGDSLCILFQDEPIQSGGGKQLLILGAEIKASGKVCQAFGFQLPDGSWDYFDAKGASLKRTFLRSPVNYRTLLTDKTAKNIKIVAKTSRAHFGTDYAAPIGTSVAAIGDGVVSAIRRNGKRGFSIEIRHRGGYRSLYGNLFNLSRGLTRGSVVSQSETIGSIGGNGRAYLEFRLYKDGRPVNFQTSEFVRSKFIPKSIFTEFEKSRDFCTAALHGAIADGQEREVLSGRD
jgi:murein DD-endopeptidase MepM/ murein hydrolase activator NlpD